MKRLTYSCMVGFLWLGSTSLCVAHATKSRPNVIVIYTDDQGYGDASCYNARSKIPTPNIDRLAAEGMRFTDGHCSDTVCTPSRYGLLTGRYSWRTTLKRGVFGAEKPGLIADGRMTIASLNYGVLAWFEGRFAKVPPTLYTKKKPNDLNPGDYRIMPPYETELKPDLMEVAPDFVDGECLTRFTDKAIAWIQDHAAAAREGKPFLLYLPYTAPHLPVIPLEQFRGKSGCGAYGDFMVETDWHIGRLLEVLDAEQLTRDTLVFFSSDNGPENPWQRRIAEYQHYSSGPYREGKRSIYEGGHRVPFIVRWPARVKAGGVCEQPVCQTDLLATLAEVLGKPLPPNAGEDSVSFLSALVGQPAVARAPLIHHAANGRFAIREGRWKLVMEHGRTQPELYDIDADPGEQKNLIAPHSDIAARLTEKITDIVQNGRTTPGPKQPNDTGWWSDLAWIPGEGTGKEPAGAPNKPRKNKTNPATN